MQANKRLIQAAKELLSITMVEIKRKAQRRTWIEGKTKTQLMKLERDRVDFGARKIES